MWGPGGPYEHFSEEVDKIVQSGETMEDACEKVALVQPGAEIWNELYQLTNEKKVYRCMYPFPDLSAPG